jgi:NADPH:quinone reductase-like Zn-dependent oxidoreductase
MKAAVYAEYGPPDVVRIADIEKPVPRGDEVLLKVRAASVNPLDFHFLRGTPYLIRILGGLRKPKETRLGVDIAGRVEAVGEGVTEFKPGDEVFGSCRGAFAEYACTGTRGLVTKPDNVTFEQAAAAPVAAFTALQGFRTRGRIEPGQKILINGAAGGVGTFAVQIARSFGAEVTGVCSTRNVEMVSSIGAQRVVDYTRENFTLGAHHYDLIFDCVGNHSLLACRRVLNRNGRYIAVGGPSSPWMLGFLARAIAAPLLSRLVSQKMAFVGAKSSKEDLTMARELMASGQLTPVIDRRYPLSEVPEALRYLESGHARGKVVITF